jgi:hypothetical protein
LLLFDVAIGHIVQEGLAVDPVSIPIGFARSPNTLQEPISLQPIAGVVDGVIRNIRNLSKAVFHQLSLDAILWN